MAYTLDPKPEIKQEQPETPLTEQQTHQVAAGSIFYGPSEIRDPDGAAFG